MKNLPNGIKDKFDKLINSIEKVPENYVLLVKEKDFNKFFKKGDKYKGIPIHHFGMMEDEDSFIIKI